MCGACSSDMVDTRYEIEEREEEDPDVIDEVPVEAHDLDRPVVLGSEVATPRARHHPQQQAGTDDHMQRVEAGHPPIEGHKELNLRRQRRDLVPGEVHPGKESLV